MTIEQIKEKMEPADATTISKLTGFTSDYVRKVIDGQRNSERVLEVAQKVIKNREELFKQC